MNTTQPGTIGTAKDKTIAAAKGSENIVEKTVDGASYIVTTTVKDAAKVAGAVETAATSVVKGAVEGVKEMAVKTEHAAAAVAGGAVKAVGEVATATIDTVRQTVTKPANSDKAGPKGPEMATSKN